ncbi:DUF2147 domain-containing protein [Poritiphilus flavus]|uniref:DUF2147 domain-containing protein n=1 Tax=Poritiphilus flavus TaxID=2697053 RepID=A0A6L9EAD0_9FLAO|nr:DUF2147 domain-containing protein [Poritiphilus flavus]NAS11725.1 DUF2147 domain-containing protein [Poritiphilus flavus]
MSFKKNSVFLLLAFLSLSFSVNAQSIFGRWKTIDDKTGKPKAIVHIYRQQGKMFGKIEKVLEKNRQNAVCKKCEGDKKDQPIVGLEIMAGLVKNGEGEWKGKNLLDPESGTTYRCKIWLNPKDPNELMVRGYIAFLYRTQTWIRAKE